MTFRRVIKLGGSLLQSDNLKRRLREWISSQSNRRDSNTETLVVVGGGQLVDAIRRSDKTQPREPEVVHWQCVDLLESTHKIVRSMFPDWKVIDSPDEFENGMKMGFDGRVPTLVSVSSFYRRDTSCSLPTDWRTTSDSIAAYLSQITKSDELVLLKSCEVDPESTLKGLSEAGIVDQALPAFESVLRKIRAVRLAD